MARLLWKVGFAAQLYNKRRIKGTWYYMCTWMQTHISTEHIPLNLHLRQLFNYLSHVLTHMTQYTRVWTSAHACMVSNTVGYLVFVKRRLSSPVVALTCSGCHRSQTSTLWSALWGPGAPRPRSTSSLCVCVCVGEWRLLNGDERVHVCLYS